MRKIEHHDYIKRLSDCGGRMVICASDIRPAASLLRLGYVLAEDSHDGPEIHLTEPGQRYIERAAADSSVH